MDRKNTFTAMKYTIYFTIVMSLLLTGCISPEKEDFNGGVWRADDGATVYLNDDGSAIINQINWSNIVSGGENKKNVIDLTGKWEFTTAFNNLKVIEFCTDHLGSFEMNGFYCFSFDIKGRGIFENKQPFDLFIYIGDPDERNRYIFKKLPVKCGY
jgi:hypothetical protein